MADERRRSKQEMDQLLATYQAHSGMLAYGQSGTKTIDNPAFLALTYAQKARNEFSANPIPEKITVPVYSWQNPTIKITAYQDPLTGEYVTESAVPDITPTLPRKETPQKDALDEAKAKAEMEQRNWNRDHGPRSINPDTGEPYGAAAEGSGLEETHVERVEREAKIAAARRLQEQDARQQKIDEETAAARRLAEQNQAATLRINQAQEVRAAQKHIEDVARQREQDRIAQQTRQEDIEYRNRPQPVSTPTDTAANVAVWNPATQQMESVPNPIYDEAKVQAARLKDQLSTGIALNQITAQQAAQQYKQWWDTNVELPFKQAAEVRARAAEQREALAAEDRRKQFASDFSLRQANLGFSAGDAAVKNEISLLPYRAGPTEAAEMSAAITSLGQGGKIAGPDAGAGIHFTPEAFQFDRPDFDKIAKKATSRALKGITKYSPQGTFSQGDYAGISMPTGQGAPSSTTSGIDLSQLWNQYLQTGAPKYEGPSE